MRTLQAWLGAIGIDDDAVFRSGDQYGPLRPGRLSDKPVELAQKRAGLQFRSGPLH